jgi:N6-L-threonylcarbamoyladenine synthase
VRVLGIETSCDDTAAAVVEGRAILSSTVASQDDVHAAFGGVVPELAARRHLETVSRVISRALFEAGVSLDALDAIAVTRGPGLVGSLLVGLGVAQGLALRTGLPLWGVNHLEGHVLSALLGADLEPPFVCLLASGGHTSLYCVRDVGRYEELGRTRDDSAGEAFDKAAKMLGLGYPGGRVIDTLAREGDPDAFDFPRARVRADAMALSFSGLKTALWDFLREEAPAPVPGVGPLGNGATAVRAGAREATAASGGGAPARLADVCASFQEAIVDVLVDRVVRAMEATGVRRVAVVGGVSANSRLRSRMHDAVSERGGMLALAPLALCADNAAMIAYAGLARRERGLPAGEPTAASRLPLGDAR